MKTYLVDFENVKSKGLVGIDKLTADDNVIIFYSENSDTISFEMHCLVMKAKANVEYMKVRVGGKNALDFQLSTLLGYIVAKGNNTHVFVISGDKGFDKLHDFWENTFPDSPECKVFRTVNISSALHYIKCNTRTDDISEQPDIPADDISDIPDSDISDISENDITDISVDQLPDIIIANMPAGDIPDIPAPVSAGDIYTEVLSGKVVEIAPDSVETTSDPLTALVPDITDAEREVLTELLRSTHSKIDLHNELMKKLDNERTTYIYNHIKGDYFNITTAFVDKPAEDTVTAPEPAAAESESKPAAKPKKAAKTAAKKKETQGKKVTPTEKKKLHSVLDESCTGDEFSGIVAQFNCSATAQQLYINLMQRFGQERGRELYKIVKPEFLAYNSDGGNAKKTTAKKLEKAPAVPAAPSVSDGDALLRQLSAELIGDDEYDKLRGFVISSDSVHSLYLSLIKGFGKKRGTAIYNKIKKEHAALAGSLSGEVTVS